MNITTRSALCIAATLAALGMCGPAIAAPVTITTSGVIGSGTDETDTFSPTGDLTNAPYTLTTTLDLSGYGPPATGSAPPSVIYLNNSLAIGVTVTINGITGSDTFTSIGDELYLQTGASSGTVDEVGYVLSGTDTFGNTLSLFEGFATPNPTGLTLDPTQFFSYNPTTPPDQTLVEFQYASAGRNIDFFAGTDAEGAGTLANLTLNSSVPEPGTLMLTGIALLGFAAIRPRRVLRR